jgi:hypothetical protein
LRASASAFFFFFAASRSIYGSISTLTIRNGKEATDLLLLLLGLRVLLRLLLRGRLVLLAQRRCGGPRLGLLLRVARVLLLLLDARDPRVGADRDVDELAQACVILLLPAGTLRLVLLLSVPLVVAAVSPVSG